MPPFKKLTTAVSHALSQAALAKEKSERARIVLSLRDTITGLKQAGDVEGRLKADLVQTHEDLASSRAAQVHLWCACVQCLSGEL